MKSQIYLSFSECKVISPFLMAKLRKKDVSTKKEKIFFVLRMIFSTFVPKYTIETDKQSSYASNQLLRTEQHHQPLYG
jgi:hypothetical protein